ncbi:MAG: tRNA (adenosine(37)-N6)-threonylcarbamoyltransferase complex dimerization subunit type 1 TsaB [Bacteroidetes bacterium]|nr:tRNA (adenosine(37)-N6)-threonylcarbamoyltransferase complex dimerization subunit type 1 TsaB [Bacteroidota bacterium]MBK7503829.1 tRNA (adenosine(37)-N6)-threonylcarbamoyltransferase complex dimerization subunit type 1 TsaB [Bacteroidota bacterium]MBK8674100.1 tRNA (adenosine(37)-N6)-threonylcarbamoyltransferase complex dimerization subunit type 1 TsaB [Bacteroidota bacterium]MBP7256712.1 tRNA (adenosine(37)-N6)-threonylcarbamoyltransferase complex dimerization subunit type 1 TsaB [Chitinoph
MKTIILLIETAAQVCSVALASDGVVIGHKFTNDQKKSQEVINDLIAQIFEELSFSINQLSAVAISGGPGSYTGLRVGASCAKGICYALDIPLIHIDSMSSMIEGIKKRYNQLDYDIFFPMIDARRMEVFCRAEDKAGNCILETNHQFLDQQFLESIIENRNALFFGNGASKVKSILPNYKTLIEDFMPSAEDIAQISYQKFLSASFESIAYYEPRYLKEVFISAKKEVKTT